MEEAASRLYVEVICALLLRGVNWQYVTRNFTQNQYENVKRRDLHVKLDTIYKWVPPFEFMTPDQLYHPLNPSYPAADMLYKTEDGILVIIQVNRQRAGNKKIHMSDMQNLFEVMKLTEDQIKQRVKIVLVPPPSVGLSQIMEVEGTEEMNCLTEYDVWQVPLKYDH
jgi:hypothetical protein